MVSINPRLAGFELEAFVSGRFPAIEGATGIPGPPYGEFCVIPGGATTG